MNYVRNTCAERSAGFGAAALTAGGVNSEIVSYESSASACL